MVGVAIGFMVEYTATCSSLSGMWESGPDHVVYPDFDTDIVLTGELENFTRDVAKDIIRKEGGDISSSVSRYTDYVVAGENPGSKYQKAKSLGVKVIGEKEFLEML